MAPSLFQSKVGHCSTNKSNDVAVLQAALKGIKNPGEQWLRDGSSSGRNCGGQRHYCAPYFGVAAALVFSDELEQIKSFVQKNIKGLFPGAYLTHARN